MFSNAMMQNLKKNPNNRKPQFADTECSLSIKQFNRIVVKCSSSMISARCMVSAVIHTQQHFLAVFIENVLSLGLSFHISKMSLFAI